MLHPNEKPHDQPSPVGTDERRAWVRYGCDLDALCQATGPLRDSGWMGKVKNISAGGVGLLLRHRFRAGTPLLIELKNPTGSYRRNVPARVVHVAASRTGDSGWLTGCAFLEPLSDEDLLQLL